MIEPRVGNWFGFDNDINLIGRLAAILIHGDGKALSSCRRHCNLGSSGIVAPLEAGAATGAKYGAAARTNALVEPGIGDGKGFNGNVDLIGRLTTILGDRDGEALGSCWCYRDFGGGGVVTPFENRAAAGAEYGTTSCTNALIQSRIGDGFRLKSDINLIGRLTTILSDGDREALGSRRCYCNLGSSRIVAPFEAGAATGTKYGAASCTNTLV